MQGVLTKRERRESSPNRGRVDVHVDERQRRKQGVFRRGVLT